VGEYNGRRITQFDYRQSSVDACPSIDTTRDVRRKAGRAHYSTPYAL